MSSLHSNNHHDAVDDHHFSPPIETSDAFWPFLQDNIDSLLLPLHNTYVGIDVSNHPANENSAVISNTSIDERPDNIFTNKICDFLDNSPDNHYSLYHHRVLDDQTLLDDQQMKVSDDPLLTSAVQESAAILEPQTACKDGMDSSAVLGEQNSLMLVESGREELRKDERMGKGKMKQRLARMMLKGSKEEGPTSKKEEHNAKEKVRRMKLNASYLALGSLLPHSRRSKKRRWSAPVVIDKVLEYIPELETEIAKLKLKKENLLSKAETKQPMQQNYENAEQTSAPTISIHQVKQGEVIVQFCQPKKQQKNLSDVLLNIETESMNIVSASSIDVCEDSICYHLHLKLNGDQAGSDNLAMLKERISCLLN